MTPTSTPPKDTMQELMDLAFSDEFGLNSQQFMFVWLYAGKNFSDAANAAREAGYSEQSSRVANNFLLKNPRVDKFIRHLVRERLMDEAEVKWRLARIASGSMEHFLSFGEDSEGIARWRIDLNKAENAGQLFLLKKVKETKNTLEIEMHDPLKALELLTKVLGMQIQKHVVLGEWREAAEEYGIPVEQAEEVYAHLKDQVKNKAKEILEAQNVAQTADAENKR